MIITLVTPGVVDFCIPQTNRVTSLGAGKMKVYAVSIAALTRERSLHFSPSHRRQLRKYRNRSTQSAYLSQSGELPRGGR